MDSTCEQSDSATPASDAPAGIPFVQAPAEAFYNSLEISTQAKADKFAHTRGKRKRTSREDYAVLESEYQRNPRPDKDARMSIVERVSLSEKAVQVWFQNRRQMTRRKCRTWQPNEITAIIRSSQEQNDTDGPDSSFVDNDDFNISQPFSTEVSYLRHGQPSPNSSQEDLGSSSSVEQDPENPLDSRKDSLSETIPEPPSSSGRKDSISASSTHRPSSSFQDTANDSEDCIPSSQGDVDSQLAQQHQLQPRRTSLKRKASAARLSTSLDGKAEIVIGNNSPSPFKKHSNPIERSRRSGALQRSQSAINPVDYQLGVDIPDWRKAKPHGRSRDARAWEFYCDSDTRNALVKTAEYEKNGSAQGVLSLIRSKSNSRKPLRRLGKENVTLQRSDSFQGKPNSERLPRAGKLERAMSSMARLQSPNTSKTTKVGQRKEGMEIWEDNFGDSDKENLDPDGTGRVHFDKHAGSVLGESQTKGRNQAVLQGDDPQKADKTKSARAHRELDAVQQLLSLSQGAWQ